MEFDKIFTFLSPEVLLMEHRQNLTSMSFPVLLEHNRTNYGDNPALGFDGSNSLNYKKMHRAVQAVKHRLKSLGVRKGDKIALLAANSPQWVVAYFSVVSMGAVVVPMLSELQEPEIENILTHSESSLIFVSERLSKKIHQDKHPLLKHLIIIDTLLENCVDGDTEAYDLSLVNDDDLAAILYTSGSTGDPKAVMLSHENLISNTIQGDKVQPVYEDDRFLSVLPLAHTYENTLGLLLPVLNGASVTYLKKPPTATVLLPAMKRVKPTMMLTVPMIIEKVVRKQVFSRFEKGGFTGFLYGVMPVRKLIHRMAGRKLKKAFGGNLKFFGIGGAKLDKKVERFLRDAGFPYAIGYGLTETSPLSAGSNSDQTKLQSTGPAVAGVDIKISTGENGSTPGEILIKGPNVMMGYYKNSSLSSKVFTKDGYFRSGDLGEFDAKGNLYLKGRSKNMILGANGENIYPEDIESLINNFAYVTESVVVERKGKLVALVHFNRDEIEALLHNLKDDVQELVENKLDELSSELKQFVNTRVNKYSRLQTVVVQNNEFEKTATRKIKRFLYH